MGASLLTYPHHLFLKYLSLLNRQLTTQNTSSGLLSGDKRGHLRSPDGSQVWQPAPKNALLLPQKHTIVGTGVRNKQVILDCHLALISNIVFSTSATNKLSCIHLLVFLNGCNTCI